MSAAHSIDADELQETIDVARERKRARSTRIGKWEYLRFDAKVRFIPEGTALFGDDLIWGYPKIGRILQLEAGIAAQFEKPFWIEEKIDGYNVRIFRHGEDVLAITRRGYICPFTTDRVPDFIDIRIFGKHPELVLCAEVAGPDNPYNEGRPPFIPEDIRFYVFDIMRKGEPDFLPQREKRRLLEDYALPSVSRFGRYELPQLGEIKELMLKLDREGREGIVLKEDSPRDYRVKYVTGRINISDIRVSKGSVRQLPPEYFMHRILRLALFLEEHGLEVTPAIQRELGEALIDGIVGTVEQFREENKVLHGFRCRFRKRANAELMVRDMKSRLGKRQMRQRRLEKEADYYVLEFEKILPKTTGLLQNMLSGDVVFD